jgi:L-fuculose-phosphate aldolase
VRFPERKQLLETAQRMAARGLAPGTSGNVSLRLDDGGMLITPSGVPYDTLRGEDLVEVDARGECRANRRPSSEWRLHRELYLARSDAGAIVHTHSTNATALACLRREIPAFHYMVAIAGGNDVRCARYATFGTAELAACAVDALRGRRACLLANHGAVALGSNLPAALRIAEEIEVLATQYLAALAVGAPVILDDAEMAAVHERFAGYGLPR